MTPPGSETPDPRPAPAHRLHYVARTDRGLIRSTNQDSLFAGDRLLVVADGMGGHAAGDTASRLVVDAFLPLNLDKPGPDLLRPLLEAARTGNAAIADMVTEHPDLEGMGTTVTAMLFDDGRAALAHVGDSRAYLYRDGVLHQLTHDDTFVQSLVDDGRITEHQAHEHPQRNLLLRALTGQELDPMLVEREIRVGDRYMLCSDGLSGVVDPESIADALAHPDPEIAADTLIQLALVNGGPDNVTTIVADVLATGSISDADAVPVGAPAPGRDDPASTSPIARLTREMPRVPLPPIPEEPAAPAEVLGEDEEGEDVDSGEDRDIDDAAADVDNSGDSGDAASGLTAGRVRAGIRNASAGVGADGESRSADGDMDRPPRRGDTSGAARRHWYRRGAVIVAALVLLGVAITGSTLWVRHQYYVSEQGNVVVVFRGVNGSLLGWRFSTFEETSCAGDTDCIPMKVSDLQPAAQNQVRAGIKVTSLAGARTVVQRLSAQLLPPCPPPGQVDDEHDAAPATSTPASSAPPATSPPDTAPATTPTTSSPPQATTAPAAATVPAPMSPTSPAASAGPPTAADILAADAASIHTTGTTDTAASTETGPAAADLAGQAFGPAVPDAAVGEDGVISVAVSASTDSTTSPSDTVTATPLAPATPIPGVTCRTVQ